MLLAFLFLFNLKKTPMTKNLFKIIFPVVIATVLSLTACSDNNGRGHEGGKDNDNRGNHSTDPAQPSDSEYPGSKLYDSVKGDSTRNH
jgi:hypothetical protein